MKAITILNYNTGVVEIVRLSLEQEKELAFKYDNNVEEWLSENFPEIRLNDCYWMATEDYPEIYEYEKCDGKWREQQVFTTP